MMSQPPQTEMMLKPLQTGAPAPNINGTDQIGTGTSLVGQKDIIETSQIASNISEFNQLNSVPLGQVMGKDEQSVTVNKYENGQIMNKDEEVNVMNKAESGPVVNQVVDKDEPALDLESGTKNNETTADTQLDQVLKNENVGIINGTGRTTSYSSVSTDNSSLSLTCTPEYKNSHNLLLDSVATNTGRALYDLYCALIMASTLCYTVVIDTQAAWLYTFITPTFDIFNITLVSNVNKALFHNLTLENERIHNNLAGYNISLMGQCRDYELQSGATRIFRSSVKLKSPFVDTAGQYLSKTVGNASVASVYIESVHDDFIHSNLSVYKPFVNKAIANIKLADPGVLIVVICSGIQASQCREHFNQDGVMISPYETFGENLALLSLSDHVILTSGLVGWPVSLMSGHKSVVYNPAFLYPSVKQIDLPNWIALQ